MDDQSQDTLERIRQQFDRAPYPRIPLEQSPEKDANVLFIHSLVTSYYLRHQKFTETSGKTILDAGCGSGYSSLKLAFANPGARIVGIDLSEESIKLAAERLKHNGFDNFEFHALSLYDVSQLGQAFDYINCDETLYLLPDPAAGLQVLKSVLKPKGIIRSNLHSALQRQGYFRGQAMCKMLGLMDDNPGEFEVEVVTETMNALREDVLLKVQHWNHILKDEQGVLVNYLLLGDKGFTIPDLFEMLRATNLDFVSMTNWRHWEVTDLFKDADNPPAFMGMSLMGASMEERLRLFELLNPINRLLDFWCAPADESIANLPIDAWSDEDWQSAIVHLHPQLRTDAVREALTNCVEEHNVFPISSFLTLPTLVPILVDSAMAICLLPLWEGRQPFMALVNRYLKLRPLNPITLEPTSTAAAFNDVKQLLSRLEAFLYILVDRSA